MVVQKSGNDLAYSTLKYWVNLSEHRSVDQRFTGNQCDCDCDACAGSIALVKGATRTTTQLSPMRGGEARNLYLSPTAYLSQVGKYTVALGNIGEGPVVLNADILPFIKLTQKGLHEIAPEWSRIVPEQVSALLLAVGVLSSSKSEPKRLGSWPEVLTAWLHLTNQCNLSCAYCYVNHTAQKMDIPIAQSAVDAVYRSAAANGYSHVKLKYAGGEPTLNFQVLEAAQRRAEQLSEQTGIALETVILTNGIHLAESQIDTLLAHNIRIMVSLDGLGAYQDEQRSLPERGNSSFMHVSKTLDRLLGRGISPHISITITEQNIDGLPELVEYLLDRQLHFGLNFYRPPDHVMLQNHLTLTQERLIEGLKCVYRVVEQKLPRYSLMSTLADRADLNLPHTRTCGVGQNYMVIDCNGNIAKCQMDMAHPITTIRADNPLAVIRGDAGRIQNLPVDQKECHECVWRYRCTGGCPRLTYQHSGRYDARSPLCEVYQAILPEVVRLEALRLVKYEKPLEFYPLSI